MNIRVLCVPVMLIVGLVGWLAWSGGREPQKLTPRRSSPYPPAYVVHTFINENMWDKSGDRDPTRMFVLVPIKSHRDKHGQMVLTLSDLYEHYRIDRREALRAPTALPFEYLGQKGE